MTVVVSISVVPMLLADNYDSSANTDDGSCIRCTDASADNYDPGATDDGSCNYCDNFIGVYNKCNYGILQF